MAKMTKKELRTPDQVWQASATSMKWMRESWLKITIFLGLLFVAFLVSIYITQQQREKEAAAQLVFSEVGALFEQWKIEPEAPEASETLTKIQGKLEQLGAEYPKSKANALAELFRSQIYIKDSNWELAAQSLEKYSAGLPSAKKDMGLYPLAVAYEESKNWEKALDSYDQVLELKSSVYRPWSLLGKARVLRELNRSVEAASTYDIYLQENANSPEASKVRGLKNLSSKNNKTTDAVE